MQEAFRIPNRYNQKRTFPCHITVKMLKLQNKERILKAAKEKLQLTYKSNPVRIASDLSAETLKARKGMIYFKLCK
jgi:hypothetical protein